MEDFLIALVGSAVLSAMVLIPWSSLLRDLKAERALWTKFRE